MTKKISNAQSQKKLRKILVESGKVPISDYILENTKEQLIKIKKANGYRRIGDSIDHLVKLFPQKQ